MKLKTEPEASLPSPLAPAVGSAVGIEQIFTMTSGFSVGLTLCGRRKISSFDTADLICASLSLPRQS